MAESAGRTIRGKPVKKLGGGVGFAATAGILSSSGLASVCREAACPNRAECWSDLTAAFLLLGSKCTRGCRFCSVEVSGSPPLPDPVEPKKVADAARAMGLKYVVLTSVTRDDLSDGGAGAYAATVTEIKSKDPEVLVETLTPDYLGENLRKALAGGQEVFAHNVETVERLTLSVRHHAFSYRRSLETLIQAKNAERPVTTKSSLLLGLGEREEEVVRTLADLRDAGVSILAIGQYFSPSQGKLEASETLPQKVFDGYAQLAREVGFSYVSAGPLVRTSYRAFEGWRSALKCT